MDYKQDSHYEETVMMKSPKTYEEQVEIIKRKGFIVDDDETCKSFLKQANYYRLSAYFLPFRNADGTYFENINEISFDVALDRYLKLYFHQDIQFYKTRLGTVEHINNLKAIRNEIFKYGFYNITVLEIKKNWKLWYGKTNIYLI